MEVNSQRTHIHDHSAIDDMSVGLVILRAKYYKLSELSSVVKVANINLIEGVSRKRIAY